MKKSLWLLLAMVLCGTLIAAPAVQTAATSAKSSGSASKTAPGVEIAQTLSMITGVAISPLLGVSAVGAWKYFGTASEKRAQLPWYAQPWFWIPALLLVAACFAKDALGTSAPTALKKPFDVAELFENKISALVAAGIFVPLVASVFNSSSGGDTAGLDTTGLAFINPSILYSIITVPFALVAFVVVWLVAHAINVLIVISPFTTVDTALKSARLFLLSTVPATSFMDPYLGAAWALVIILIACFLAGWSLRMTAFGSVFAWDFLTLRRRRFAPDRTANWMFTARKIGKVPIRTYGKLTRGEQGQLVLNYRPWLILPPRTLTLPPGQYAIGCGLFHPDLLRIDGESPQSICQLPPRYRTHEEALSEIYRLAPVQDVGLRAMWRWLKELFGFHGKPAAASV